jgi:serine protease Do
MMRSLLLATTLVVKTLGAQDPAAEQIYDELQKIDRVNPVVLVAQAVTPAVVFIQTEVMQPFWGGGYVTAAGAGSGVVVKSSGFIVTNYHVVRGARRIQVSFAADLMPWPAEVVSYREHEDLALLRVLPREERGGPVSVPPLSSAALRGTSATPLPTFETARMGTSSDLMPGEQVIAIGNPHGQSHTVSTGIISGLHRDVPIADQGLFFSDLIQTDASINSGNSGGPLLNIRGELIGINTAMNKQAENIGFAIPVDRVVEVLNDHLFPEASTSWMGFELASDDGFSVGRVWPDGPAEEAGLCEGDRVLSIGGRVLEESQDWMDATVGIPPGQPVEVRYQRGSRRGELALRPWDKIDGLTFERLGMTLREVSVDRSRWLLVDEIADGGPAQRTGLQPDDLIAGLEPVGERPRVVRDKRSLAQLLQELKPGMQIEIEIYRDDNRDRRYANEERYDGRIAAR